MNENGNAVGSNSGGIFVNNGHRRNSLLSRNFNSHKNTEENVDGSERGIMTGKRTPLTADDIPTGSTPDDNFINAIMGREPVGSPPIWGLRVIELTEAAWASAAKGGVPVTVERVAI